MTQRKQTIILMAIIIVFLVSGTVYWLKQKNKINTNNWLIYRNEEFGFTFKYPEGWGPITGYDRYLEIKSRPSDPYYAPIDIFIKENSSKYSFEDWYIKYFLKRREELLKFEKIKKGDVIFYKLPNDVSGSIHTYYLTKDDNAFIFRASKAQEDIEKQNKMMEAIVLTLDFTKKPNKEPEKQIIAAELIDDIDTSAWTTYRNEEYGFELKYPKVWEIIYDFKGTTTGVGVEIDRNVFNILWTSADKEYGNEDSTFIANLLINYPLVRVSHEKIVSKETIVIREKFEAEVIVSQRYDPFKYTSFLGRYEDSERLGPVSLYAEMVQSNSDKVFKELIAVLEFLQPIEIKETSTKKLTTIEIPTENWLTYYNKEWGINLHYPPEWGEPTFTSRIDKTENYSLERAVMGWDFGKGPLGRTKYFNILINPREVGYEIYDIYTFEENITNDQGDRMSLSINYATPYLAGPRGPELFGKFSHNDIYGVFTANPVASSEDSFYQQIRGIVQSLEFIN